MVVRSIIALLCSPWYGLLALLAVIPLTLFVVVVIALLVMTVLTSGDGPSGFVVSVLFAVLTALVAFLLSVLLSVQTARYAASFSGARFLRDQPGIRTAWMRGITVYLLLTLLMGMLAFLLSALAREFWLDLGLPELSVEEVQVFLLQVAAYMDGTGLGDPAVLRAGQAAEVLHHLSMALSMLTAVILVPRVTGMGHEVGRILGLSHFLYRFLLALPCLALMTLIAAEVVITFVETFLGAIPDAPRWGFRFNLQAILFGGAAMAHEAMLLRGVREMREEAHAVIAVFDRDPTSVSELRARWSQSP